MAKGVFEMCKLTWLGRWPAPGFLFLSRGIGSNFYLRCPSRLIIASTTKEVTAFNYDGKLEHLKK